MVKNRFDHFVCDNRKLRKISRSLLNEILNCTDGYALARAHFDVDPGMAHYGVIVMLNYYAHFLNKHAHLCIPPGPVIQYLETALLLTDHKDVAEIIHFDFAAAITEIAADLRLASCSLDQRKKWKDQAQNLSIVK